MARDPHPVAKPAAASRPSAPSSTKKPAANAGASAKKPTTTKKPGAPTSAPAKSTAKPKPSVAAASTSAPLRRSSTTTGPGGAATKAREQARASPHEYEVHIYIPPIPQDPFDESVYDLIPIAVTPPAKHARHRSKFAPLARQEYWSGTKPMASMGPLRVVSHGPERYLKRGDGDKLKPDVPKHHPDKSVRKAPLPDEPGLIPGPSGTDFVKSNRATMVHSEPPAPAPAPRSFRRKANYGRAPTYLEQRKMEMDHLHEVAYLESGAAALAAEGAGGGDMVLLPESERRAIVEGLRANWEKLNSEYQKLSLTVDTVPKIARKVNMEQQLKRIEEDILRFSHENIYVKFES